MSQEHVEQFIREAQQSMQTGHFASGLELCEQAIALNPSSSEAHVLRGVALAQLNRPEEATQAFRTGIQNGPQNAKAFFNLAVHFHQQGQKAQAEEMATATLRIDPDHAGAKSLVAGRESANESNPAMGGDMPPMISDLGNSSSAAEPIRPTGIYRPGYDTSSEGSLQFATRMGRGWIATGIVLAMVSLVAGVANWVMSLRSMADLGVTMGDPTGLGSLFQASGGWISVVATLVSLTSLVWMIFDLVHRRGNWLWMLPYILCCCCSLGGLTQLIYIWQGRK